jgi:photosystem I subunit 11
MSACIQASFVAPRVAMRRSSVLGNGVAGLKPIARARVARVAVKAMAADKAQVITPLNNDPFIGMLETPVTSAPIVSGFLSNLPAYRTGVSPVLRGTEIGLTHGFFLAGPFIKLGPLRDSANAEVIGCLAAAGLVGILAVCLAMYGAVSFQTETPLGNKTLSGRATAADPLQTADGWGGFTSGWVVGGFSGVAWAYVCTQILPFYQ